jgi:hypothetical protein
MNDQVPVAWADKLAESAKEVAKLERPALSQISLRAGVMTYQKQPVPGNKLMTVIVSQAFENKWFGDKKFDPNKYEAPGCYALSLTGEAMVPHEDAKDPQADNCEVCEQSKWGSAGGGSKGKACKEVRRLALIPAAALKDGNVATAELAVISIPVTSARNWANYVNTIAAEFQRPPWGMLTEISVVPDARTQFQVKFEAKGLVSDEYLPQIYKRVEGANMVLLTPYDDSGTVAQAPDPLPNRKY